jgi:hypothetical protein
MSCTHVLCLTTRECVVEGISALNIALLEDSIYHHLNSVISLLFHLIRKVSLHHEQHIEVSCASIEQLFLMLPTLIIVSVY